MTKGIRFNMDHPGRGVLNINSNALDKNAGIAWNLVSLPKTNVNMPLLLTI